MGSAFECCDETTSPSPLLTKEGTLGRSTILFTHANVGSTKFNSSFPFPWKEATVFPYYSPATWDMIFPSVDYDPDDVWKETFPNESLS